MASLDDLSTALRNADAAGDVDAARMLATEITKQQRSGVGDYFKSLPRGLLGGLSHAGSALGQATMHEMGQPEGAAEIPNAEQTTQHLERNVTGELPKPEGKWGKYGAATGEALGNPVSFVGPGGLPLKVGGAILSAMGSEGAGQATEGTRMEGPARLIGALAGGVTAGKALGPTAERAVTPTAKELLDIGGRRFDVNRTSDLVLDPKGFGQWAAGMEGAAERAGFTPGRNGTAPKTRQALDEAQYGQLPGVEGATPSNIDAVRANLSKVARETQPTAEGVIRPSLDAERATKELERLNRVGVTAQGLEELRNTLKNIAKETQANTGGAIVATQDAAAATRTLKGLADYMENIPQSHVLAGDAATYVRNAKIANADYAAGARTRDFDARLTKAENTTDRQVAGSLDSQIKSKAGQMLDNPTRMRGMNAAEKAQLQLINSGGPVSNTLRQLGRGGAGVIPLMGQLAAAPIVAATTGGVGTAVQAGLAAALYAARKGSEKITSNRAEKLVEMLAKRSPEYESRVANLPQVSSAPNKAAIVRALLGQ